MVTNDRDYQRNYIKQYVKSSPIIQCQCGAHVKSYNIYHHHRRSKKHFIFVNPLPDVNNLKNEIKQLKEMINVIP